MSLNAYQKTLNVTESTRNVEYRLFGQVTRALLDIVGTPRTDARFIDALDWNRRVWSTLALDCSNEDNALPAALRAGIISLSLFVGRYSSNVMSAGLSVQPLIDINRTIMQGLAASPAAH